MTAAVLAHGGHAHADGSVLPGVVVLVVASLVVLVVTLVTTRRPPDGEDPTSR